VRARHLADHDLAVANARRIAVAERRLGILVEPAVQRLLVRGPVSRSVLGAAYMASQVVALRTMALISWAAGVAWYSLQPVAPPRMIPEVGVSDTVSDGVIPMDNRIVRSFYTPCAAMPSLHVGMAPAVAWAVWSSSTSPAVRAAAVAYPPAVAAIVVATGQHFIADIAGGIAVVLPAWAIARRITRARRTTRETP